MRPCVQSHRAPVCDFAAASVVYSKTQVVPARRTLNPAAALGAGLPPTPQQSVGCTILQYNVIYCYEIRADLIPVRTGSGLRGRAAFVGKSRSWIYSNATDGVGKSRKKSV